RDFLEWEHGLHGKVDEVNQRLLEAIYTDQPDLYRMSRYTIEAGGKRFRPLLTILAFEISSEEHYSRIMDLAAGYELIHTASLIHDDIIDNASTRRGRPTLNAIEGTANAIVVGDYLFAKAYELGSRYGPVVSKIMADASSRLAEGQTLEAFNLGNLGIPESVYYEIISNKTARFFEACALGATTAAGAPSYVVKSLAEFAYNLGMAFQITDDILDIVGNPDKLGKPVFSDLRHNAITLPLIHLREALPKDQWARVVQLMDSNSKESSETEIKKAMLSAGSIDYAFEVARKYSEKALNALKNSPKSPDINLLMELAMIVIQRINELS
ncbi:MAG TPA: polyprenyl synthetase family protein, partial [Thermoplasmataceae archaeon]|nr:polyprenyl synthetase family protein [Thermoplasmataceae archaeon]